MKWAERIVMISLVVVLVGGAAWGYMAVKSERDEVRAAVARGEFQIPDQDESTTAEQEENWKTIFPNTVPTTIGGVVEK